MADSLEKQITDQIDEALLASIDLDDEERTARDRLHSIQSQKAALDEMARKLRMALFALTDSRKNAGEANAENSSRRAELRKSNPNFPLGA